MDSGHCLIVWRSRARVGQAFQNAPSKSSVMPLGKNHRQALVPLSTAS
jgi:hypothetical protein